MRPAKEAKEERPAKDAETESMGPMVGANVGFIGGFVIVWAGFGAHSHPNEAELVIEAFAEPSSPWRISRFTEMRSAIRRW